MTEQHEWWQRGIIYQIYPRSFQDSDGDGVGDLRGIVSRLDYLQWLGIDAVWISPIYPSPMADFGYDISDYTGVDPIFGTLDDLDELIAEAHRRGLKVVLDFVPNHTSEEHPWFVESRSSRSNPKRDWYIWRDPAPGGGPPNNWLCITSDSAWEWDEPTGQYYYHAYLKQQPDLNWRNPEVQEAMLDVLRFWLDRGVDGFRVDVIWHVVKDDQFRDNPPNPSYRQGEWPYRQLLATYSTDRPEVHDIIGRMRRLLDQYGERLLIGEIYLPVERLVTYYGAHGSGVHLPFNFQLIQLPWQAQTIASVVESYEAALPSFGWPNWVLGNHDKPRIASRTGAAQTRVAAMLLLTLRGVPTMYYGDEIGMHDVPIPPERVHDPWEKRTPGYGIGRDPVRTPMQWEDGPNAGFTGGRPWLPVAEDHRQCNVAVEGSDPRSLLSLYRRLIALRRAEPALAIGHYAPVPTEGDLMAYRRFIDGQHYLIVLNFGSRPQVFAPPEPPLAGRLVLSTYLDREDVPISSHAELREDEGIILKLDEQS